MANLHLVTGFAGQEHVTAADQGSWNAAVMGTGQFVMGKGNQFAASVISNNQIRILDGEIMMQGRYIRLEPNTYVELAIENGTQGYKRNDLVVARYTKTVSSGVEEVNLVVIKGTPSESPVDPEYISGNILEGAEQNDLPLFRVTIDGLTVTGIEKLFDVIGTTLEGLQKEITEGFEAYKEDLDNRLENHTHDGTTIGLSPETAVALGLDEESSSDEAIRMLKDSAFLDITPTRTKVERASQLPVGTSIPINVDGVAKDFIVIQQGKPSDIYDDSCSGTWLMMNELYIEKTADSTDNDYQNSDIHAYLNNEFFGLLDTDVQSAVKTAKIPYWNGKGISGSLATGANGLSVKVFLLSCIETGLNAGSYMPSDGVNLGFFASDGERKANNADGTVKTWWTRSPTIQSNSNGENIIYCVLTNGSHGTQYCSNAGIWVRPVFVLSDDTDVSNFGYYTDGKKVYTEPYSVGTIVDVFGGAVDLGGAKIETGSYTGAGTYGSSNPCSLTFGFVPQIFILYAKFNDNLYNGWGYYNTPQILAVRGQTGAFGFANGSDRYQKLTWSDETISWYCVSGTSATEQANASGTTYNYIAIG